ncbi:TetR/AcrR family transcriptional regulator [Microcella flavibacter]|uniref:TetR/AcrR family transcriptional regulator n=1 Tax=Microcella flavibacter TaxID=1804990 RepID=UPI001456B13B|nr:TetR/AcrR family transcriptional regulator [Microcella flavibacter]
MSPRNDPARKPLLLLEILEHLRERPLATITFRSLAEALGVSPFTLVYHFGTRRELMAEIIGSIGARQDRVIQAELDVDPSLDAHLAATRASWQHFLHPVPRSLLRLEFEAALLEVTDKELDAGGLAIHGRWVEWGAEAVERLGLPREIAELESRVLVDQIYGFQFDLIVSGDEVRATRAFEIALQSYGERLAAHLAATS